MQQEEEDMDVLRLEDLTGLGPSREEMERETEDKSEFRKPDENTQCLDN